MTPEDLEPAEPGSRTTVAICTRNRGRQVEQTVDSVLATSPPPARVLVIDQSTDELTADALEEHRRAGTIDYVRTTTVGIGTSRRLAVEMADTEFLAFTDDDCVVPPDWVEQLELTFDRHPDAGMVYCNVRAVPHDTDAGFVPAYERVGEHVARTPLQKCTARGIGAGMAVRVAAALDAGNFDGALGSTFPGIVGEEGDLALRLILRGHPVVETDRTHVDHDGFRTWEQGRDLTRRNFIGIGLVYAKPIRAGRLRALPVVLYEGVYVALLQPIGRALRGNPRGGFRALPHFWAGFARGIRHRVDPHSLNFAEPEGSASGTTGP